MPPWRTGAGGGGSSRRGQPEDADEDEDELLEFDLPNVRDTVLWLIDAGPKMHDTLVPDISGDDSVQISLFHQALRAAFAFQRSKLVNSPADHCGILLFNTQASNVHDAGKNVAYPNSVTVQTITQVAVPPTSELKDELQASLDEGPSYFRKKYAPNEKQSRIHHAFGNAEAMLFNSGKAGAKRIFFVTNEDNPMAEKKGRTEQQRLALEKVKSMARRGIEFEPFLISTDDHPFETSHFYADMFGAYADEEGDFGESSHVKQDVHRPWNATTKFENLEGGVEARETPKRVVFSVPMHLAPGLTVGVKGYCTLVKATKGLAVRVKAMEREDEDDPLVFKEVVVETALTCADTGRELDKERDVDTAFSFGLENNMRAKVRFSKSEVRKMRSFGQTPSIRILGFKPASELQFHENVKHAYFIYPSDTQWQNSQRAFGALLNSMAKKNCIALAMFCPRGFVIPVFAAILPQLEERGPEGQTEPPGMHVIPLPYADDIREAPQKHCVDQALANAAEIEAAEKLVKSFTRVAAFNPDYFPNPSLVHHYKVLLAVAFGDELDEDWEDTTLPKYNEIKKRAGLLVELLNDTVNSDERVTGGHFGGSGGGGASISATASTSQKRTAAAAFGHSDEPKLKRIHRDGELGSQTVLKLKAVCEYYRLSTSGKKAELVQRVEDHLATMEARDDV